VDTELKRSEGFSDQAWERHKTLWIGLQASYKFSDTYKKERDDFERKWQEANAQADETIEKLNDQLAQVNADALATILSAIRPTQEVRHLAALVQPIVEEWLASYELFAQAALSPMMQERVKNARLALAIMAKCLQ
jgi:hypothetical protein